MMVAAREQVTDAVSAAQAVLLNPTKAEAQEAGSRAFVPTLPPPPDKAAGPASGGAAPAPRLIKSAALEGLGEPTEWELSFTRNVVVVEVDGAEADLTIMDMPGAHLDEWPSTGQPLVPQGLSHAPSRVTAPKRCISVKAPTPMAPRAVVRRTHCGSRERQIHRADQGHEC